MFPRNSFDLQYQTRVRSANYFVLGTELDEIIRWANLLGALRLAFEFIVDTIAEPEIDVFE